MYNPVFLFTGRGSTPLYEVTSDELSMPARDMVPCTGDHGSLASICRGFWANAVITVNLVMADDTVVTGVTLQPGINRIFASGITGIGAGTVFAVY